MTDESPDQKIVNKYYYIVAHGKPSDYFREQQGACDSKVYYRLNANRGMTDGGQPGFDALAAPWLPFEDIEKRVAEAKRIAESDKFRWIVNPSSICVEIRTHTTYITVETFSTLAFGVKNETFGI